MFNGYHAYQLATDWGTNAGCGGGEPRPDRSFFGSLHPDSLVRFWAFQGTMATNVHTVQIDWAPLDNVFYQAAKYHVYLIPVISDQGGTCDVATGRIRPGTRADSRTCTTRRRLLRHGLTPLSYWDYMNALVEPLRRLACTRHVGADERSRGLDLSSGGEPSNCGGNQTCPDEAAAASALKYFFTTVGEQIHLLDPEHLVEDGFTVPGNAVLPAAITRAWGLAGIDVLSVHDYYGQCRWVGTNGTDWPNASPRPRPSTSPSSPVRPGIMAGNGQTGCETFTASPKTWRQRWPPNSQMETVLFWCGLVFLTHWVRAVTTLGRPIARSSTSSPLRPPVSRVRLSDPP